MKPVIILHHHEIVLKRGNRGFFEKQLQRNIQRSLSYITPLIIIRGGYGRFIIELNEQQETSPFINQLGYVFGIANICIGVKVNQDIDQFCEAAKNLLSSRSFNTIKVETRRPDKNFPIRSMDVNAKVGEYLCKEFGVRAKMDCPDETVFIEIVDGDAYIYLSKIKGAGGLPVGVSGKVVSLLSAGFDSPVASWQLMKRGATVIFVHFHSMPYTSRDSIDQVRQIVRILTRYQFQSKLYLIPFADVQQEIVLHTAETLRVILYRRMMVRIAESIARRENAEALVTGEAIGQVASQTLRNIRIIDESATFPIFRPLAGMDKEETIEIARRIGTYEISKEPYDDCCSYLVPRQPSTWASRDEVINAESQLDIPMLIQQALNKAEVEIFDLPI